MSALTVVADPPDEPDRTDQPAHVRIPSAPPAWAGDLGIALVRDSERLAHRGRTRVGEWDVDPMTILNSWAAHPRPRTSRAGSLVHGLRVRLHRPWSTYRLKPARPSSGVVVGYSTDGRTVRSVQVADLTAELLNTAHPMRTFSRRLTQNHKPVAVWTHTTESLASSWHRRRAPEKRR